MQSVSRRMLSAASKAGEYLDKTARCEIADFIGSKMNPDGGFRGRDGQSDLYYTVFAIASLRALRQRIPLSRLWKFIRSFGLGENLDFVHLVCLIRLRAVFPVLGKTRRTFFQALEDKFQGLDTAYDAFLKMLACENLGSTCPPGTPRTVRPTDPTPNVAAAVVLNGRVDEEAIKLLLSRHCEGGGFCASSTVTVPDLLSTGVALFALRTMDANLDAIREPCLEFVESLWRDSGGFAGHVADGFEDVEYTFYGLLSIGCLME
ncbi:MAG: hypothetical protein K9M45_10815 [Kiritimatiellales bacterium]|nr:hypothetical protein [Kiritimatiellales bacterium]